MPAVIDAAAATGTWIEINAAPKRLDLDWRWWPRAKEKGVKCVINPDAHRIERLRGLAVWRRRRAQRLANEIGRGQYASVRPDRGGVEAKAESMIECGSREVLE